MGSSTVKKVDVKNKTPYAINKNRTIPEVFDVVAEIDDQHEKIRALRAYRTKALMYVINLMYNTDWSHIKIPKYTPNHRPPEICTKGINTSLTDLETAYKYSTTKPEVTERVLTKVLTDVSAREAELLVDVFRGKKVKGISKTVFRKAYPQFFPVEEETDGPIED